MPWHYLTEDSGPSQTKAGSGKQIRKLQIRVHVGSHPTSYAQDFVHGMTVPDVSTHFLFFVEFWPTRESFGMARGLPFWALGVDTGPRGRAFEWILDPRTNTKYICIGAQTAPRVGGPQGPEVFRGSRDLIDFHEVRERSSAQPHAVRARWRRQQDHRTNCRV